MDKKIRETSPFDHVTFQAAVIGCILQNHLQPCTILDVHEMLAQIELELGHPISLEYSKHPDFIRQFSTQPLIKFENHQFALNQALLREPVKVRKIFNMILSIDGKMVRRVVTKKAQQQQNYITLQQLEHAGCLSKKNQFEKLYPDYALVYDERRMSKLEVRQTIPIEDYLFLPAVEEFSHQKILKLQKRAQG